MSKTVRQKPFANLVYYELAAPGVLFTGLTHSEAVKMRQKLIDAFCDFADCVTADAIGEETKP